MYNPNDQNGRTYSLNSRNYQSMDASSRMYETLRPYSPRGGCTGCEQYKMITCN